MMKRLKFSCPFGGKKYPWIVAVCAAFIMPFVFLSFELSVAIPSMIWAPICALVICFCYEQHLTPDERAIVAETPPPVWNIATPELIDEIRTGENRDGGSAMAAAGVIAFAVCLFVVVGFGISEFTLILCCLVVLGCIIAFICTLRKSEIWAQMDDSAVFIDVPIHHMYDVKHTSGRNRRSWVRREPSVWYVSYLVFYLHDGRYVLRVPTGEGGRQTVRIIKFKNSIRWMLL